MGIRVICMLVIATVGCAVALRRPFMGVLLVSFWYFFRPSMWEADAWLTPVLWWTVATGIGWLISAQGSKGVDSCGWILVLTTWLTIATLVAPLADESSWAYLWTIVKILIFVFLMIRLCDTPRRLAWLVVSVLLGCLWISKAVLVSWALSGFSGSVRVDTSVGQGGGANYIAWVFAATLPFLIVAAIRVTGWRGLGIASLVPLWLATVLATGSRAGFMAVGAAVIAVLALMRQTKVFLMAGFCAVVLFVISPAEFWERMDTVTSDPTRMEASALSRWQNWEAGMQVIKENPIFGVGLAKFPQAILSYLPADYAGARGVHVAHNTFVQMATEAGLPAAIALIVTTVTVLGGLVRRLPPNTRGFALLDGLRISTAAGLIAVLTSSMFGDHAAMDMFWWMYGIGYAILRIKKRASPLNPTPSPESSPAGSTSLGRPELQRTSQ